MSLLVWFFSTYMLYLGLDIYQSCPSGYTWCANETEICSLQGTNIIAFGDSYSNWHYEKQIGTFTCNSIDGHLSYGGGECCYQNDAIYNVPSSIAIDVDWSPGTLSCNSILGGKLSSKTETHIWQFTVTHEINDVIFDHCVVGFESFHAQLFLYNSTGHQMAGCDNCGSCSWYVGSNFTQSTLEAGAYWLKIRILPNDDSADVYRGNYGLQIICPDMGGILTCSHNSISGSTTSSYPYARFSIITKSKHDVKIINSCGTPYTKLHIYSDSTFTNSLTGADNYTCSSGSVQGINTFPSKDPGTFYATLDTIYSNNSNHYGAYTVSIVCGGKYPTSKPTPSPTNKTPGPTMLSSSPTWNPTASPTLPSEFPSTAPSAPPTSAPTTSPSLPSESPSTAPSSPPTSAPSTSPSKPSKSPSASPTYSPTISSASPTYSPSCDNYFQISAASEARPFDICYRSSHDSTNGDHSYRYICNKTSNNEYIVYKQVFNKIACDTRPNKTILMPQPYLTRCGEINCAIVKYRRYHIESYICNITNTTLMQSDYEEIVTIMANCNVRSSSSSSAVFCSDHFFWTNTYNDNQCSSDRLSHAEYTIEGCNLISQYIEIISCGFNFYTSFNSTNTSLTTTLIFASNTGDTMNIQLVLIISGLGVIFIILITILLYNIRKKQLITENEATLNLLEMITHNLFQETESTTNESNATQSNTQSEFSHLESANQAL
eukprot:250517_1